MNIKEILLYLRDFEWMSLLICFFEILCVDGFIWDGIVRNVFNVLLVMMSIVENGECRWGKNLMYIYILVFVVKNLFYRK